MNGFKFATYLLVAFIAQANCNPASVYYSNDGYISNSAGDAYDSRTEFVDNSSGSYSNSGSSVGSNTVGSTSSCGCSKTVVDDSSKNYKKGGYDHKKSEVLYVNKVAPIIVERKASAVNVDDEQSLVVKAAPVIIHRSRQVEVRPVVIKHRPTPLYIRPKVVKVFRPLHKKYFVEKYVKQEYPHGTEGEVVSRHVEKIGGGGGDDDKWESESGTNYDSYNKWDQRQGYGETTGNSKSDDSNVGNTKYTEWDNYSNKYDDKNWQSSSYDNNNYYNNDDENWDKYGSLSDGYSKWEAESESSTYNGKKSY